MARRGPLEAVVTRAELLELLTVERFTPVPRPTVVRVGPLDPPDVIDARRRALVEEARALWHDDADRVLELLPTPTERSA